MKNTKFILAAILFVFNVSLFAQKNTGEMRTLFKNTPDKKMSNGGYGSFTIGYSQIDNKDALVIGGRAAWIANHHFALGIAGNGFFNSLEDANIPDDDNSNYFLTGGYGGIFIEPIIMPNNPVHVSFPIILGIGGVTALEANNWDNYNNNNYYTDSDMFLVAEPGIDIEFNIIKFFRIAIGASYRVTNDIDLKYKYLDNDYKENIVTVDKNALNSFSFNLSFKFGWF